MQSRTAVRTLATAAAACAPLWAQAQVTQKPDGQWRSLFTAGANIAGGNTDSKSLSLSADVIKLTAWDKIALNGSAAYTRTDGDTTADRATATGLYTRDLTKVWFGFGQLDVLRDIPADISTRTTVAGGVGYHVLREADLTWDVSGGLAYTFNRYRDPQIVDDELRKTYNSAEILLAEESNQKLTDSTTFKQKLSVYPNLRNSGDVRTIFDAGLSVAMTQKLALTASFQHRYDSNPGEGLGKTDTLFITGVSVRFD